MDGPDLEIHGLDRAKRPLNAAQGLVIAHGVVSVHGALGDTCADDVDAIESGFGSDVALEHREVEALIRDSNLEVLGELAFVYRLADPHPDDSSPLQIAARDHSTPLFKLTLRRRDQRLPLAQQPSKACSRS